MPFEGEILNACGVVNVDLAHVSVVAVSGDGPNMCGHLLLYSPNAGGYYFHVTGDPNGSGNCPAVATSDSVSERVGRFYQWMASGVYGIYGLSP